MSYRKIFDLNKKVAVVVGGSGLIGREIVKGLNDFGAKVYVADMFVPPAGKTKSIKHVAIDITSETSIRSTFAKIYKEAGSIDIVINCAYPRTKDWGAKVEDVPTESWAKNVNDHMGGYFFCSRAAAELMKKKGGVIINFASTYGVAAPDFSIYEGTAMTMPVAYSAIKGGIIMFTKYLATYYAKYNIRANAISPGGVLDGQNPAFVKKYLAKTPLNRMAKSEDIVGAIIFLASDAAAYVTGHNLMVDGGWTAW